MLPVSRSLRRTRQGCSFQLLPNHSAAVVEVEPDTLRAFLGRQSHWGRLVNTPFPCIAVLREGRYLILGKAGEDKVLVQDPLASRPAMMTRAEFEAVWDGRLVLAVLHLLGILVANLIKSRQRLEIENLLLRHQLNIALRRAPHRLRLGNSDRALMVWLTWLWPSLIGLARVVEPYTILRWHRAGFRAYWRWRSGGRPGRPKIDRELRDLIRQMSKDNLLWGAPRIHGELLKLGFEVAESTVSKYLVKRRGPPSQSWRTFLCNHADAIAAIDLCVVPTISF